MSQQGMRTFSTEFKQTAVLRLEAGERIASVAEELKIRRKLLYGAHHKTGAPRGVVGYDRADDRSRERVAAEVARGLPSLYAAGRPSSLAFRADTTTSAAPPSARTLLSRLCRGVLSMSEPRTSSTEGAGRP